MGPPRRRNLTRSVPRVFECTWTMSQDDFNLFDNWWQFSIKGGSLEFDIELSDDDSGLTWYTVRALGEYKAEIIGEMMEWRVSMTLRAMGETFGTTRPAGTDELGGAGRAGITSAVGKALIYTPFRGSTSIGIRATVGRLDKPLLQGRASIGIYSTRAAFGPFPFAGRSVLGILDTEGFLYIPVIHYYSELSRQWMDVDWFGVTGTSDINTEPETLQREWMEI